MTAQETGSAAQYQPWLEAMLNIAKHYRMGVSEETVRVSLSWGLGSDPDAVLHRMAAQMGLMLRFEPYSDAVLDPWRLPLAVQLQDGQVAIVEKADGRGNLSILMSGEQGLYISPTVEHLRARAARSRSCVQKLRCPMPGSMITSSRIRPTGSGTSHCGTGSVMVT